MSKLIISSVGAIKTPKKNLIVDSEGYYKLPAGGLNVYNNVGDFYTFEESVGELFGENSPLSSRIKRGGLYAELGHPKPLPNQSKSDYIRRILSIKDDNTSLHIKGVELEETGKITNNVKEVLIWAWVKPFGPHKEVAEDSIKNPNINTSLSIRGLSLETHHMGQVYKKLTKIITWDLVTLPGIALATKFNAIGLEEFNLFNLNLDNKEDVVTFKDSLKELEFVNEDSKEDFIEIFNIVDSCKSCVSKRIINEW